MWKVRGFASRQSIEHLRGSRDAAGRARGKIATFLQRDEIQQLFAPDRIDQRYAHRGLPALDLCRFASANGKRACFVADLHRTFENAELGQVVADLDRKLGAPDGGSRRRGFDGEIAASAWCSAPKSSALQLDGRWTSILYRTHKQRRISTQSHLGAIGEDDAQRSRSVGAQHIPCFELLSDDGVTKLGRG